MNIKADIGKEIQKVLENMLFIEGNIAKKRILKGRMSW